MPYNIMRGRSYLNADTKFDVYEIIAHPTRRLILETLHGRPRSSFTELMKATGENTGSLSFHLAKIDPLLKQDESMLYSLNEKGIQAFSIIKQMGNLDKSESKYDSTQHSPALTSGEKLVLSSNKVRPLGRDHIIPAITHSLLHHVHATLTNRRLLLTGWRFFPAAEIELGDIKVVRVKRDVPLTKGNTVGSSIELTYSDHSGKLHWIRFIPPNVKKWADAIQEECSNFSNYSSGAS